ncbi:hypothetical protein TKK_0008308 [Trichogramma kaykai]
MRKYYQAFLLVTAIFSVITLLFYRHEYYKLRYVLEVFNYFGKPHQDGVKTNCLKTVNDVKKISLGLSEPLSSWQRLDEDLYLYSSFVTNSNKIQTISYGRLDNLDLNCFIFFNELLTPIPGKFSFSVIGNTSDIPGKTAYRGYRLVCEYTENMIPVGVSYQPKDQLLFNSKSPILSVKVQDKQLQYNGSAICVSPPLHIPMSNADMISFLNYHDLVGMTHFIVYDYGIPNSFHKAIKNLIDDADKGWNFTYEIIPWNFPIRDIHPNVIRKIIECDCLYRTYHKVMYATTMSWEEYLVLKYHAIVSDLLVDYERTKMYGNRYVVSSQTFCTEQKDHERSKNSTPIILKKIFTSPNALDLNLLHIYKPHESVDLKNVKSLKAASNLIILNRYVSCIDYNPMNKSNNNETSILRLAGDIINSPIHKKFIKGNMFDDQ